jgi:glycosyltransferase involved in cell wall biosynthesis
MRILLLTPVPPALGAGGAMPEVFSAQLTALRDRHEVCVVTAAGPEAWEIGAAERLLAEDPDAHVAWRHLSGGLARWRRRIRLAASWAFTRQPWRTVWFKDRAVQSLIDETCARRRFDIIVVDDNSLGTYRYPVDVPRVLTELEVRRPRRVQGRRGRGVAAWIFQEVDWRRWTGYQRRVWRRFDSLHVFGARDARLAGELLPEIEPRIAVTPFAVTLRTPPVEPIEEGLIVFVGNFRHPPNVDGAQWLAGEILSTVQLEVPRARVRIVGPNPPTEVTALASKPGVEVAGFVEDIDAEMARAAVVAAPLRIGGGMRMKVLHAMSLGKAVVTTARGIDGIIGGIDAVRVGESTAALAAHLVELLRDPPAAARLGELARAVVVQHHSPTAYADRLDESFQDLVKTAPSPGRTRLPLRGPG